MPDDPIFVGPKLYLRRLGFVLFCFLPAGVGVAVALPMPSHTSKTVGTVVRAFDRVGVGAAWVSVRELIELFLVSQRLSVNVGIFFGAHDPQHQHQYQHV